MSKLKFHTESIKIILFFIYISGWLLPKFTIFNINVGIQEIVGVLILIFFFKVNTGIYKYFIPEIIYSLFLITLSFFYFIYNSDIQGLLIGIRTFLFVLVSLCLSSISLQKLISLLKSIINLYFLFIIVSVLRIILNFYFNSFDLINMFYGSDSYRVRAPFENGGASSQVPIGYMIAMLIAIPQLYLGIWTKNIIFILGAVGTTSRASMASICLILFKKIKLKKVLSYFIIVIIFGLLYIFYLKSFSQSDSAELDGSADKRIELYTYSLQLIKNNPSALFYGFGIGSNSLENKTGESFFESFFINSFMQGGILLLVISIWIIIKSTYFNYKINLNSISFVLIIGNLVGGSNYFSMYAYPLMVLIIIIKFKSNSFIDD